MFCPGYASTEKSWMTRYLSNLKKYIIQFVMDSQYQTLVELQSIARTREIELELQVRETKVDT